MTLISGRGASPWKKQRVVIPASTTSVVHEVLVNQFRSIQYVISLFNTTQDKTKSLNLLVQQEDGALSDQVWGRLGKQLNLKVTTNLNAGKLELTIENNELFPLSIEYGYLILK